jgi:hypothetical protein
MMADQEGQMLLGQIRKLKLRALKIKNLIDGKKEVPSEILIDDHDMLALESHVAEWASKKLENEVDTTKMWRPFWTASYRAWGDRGSGPSGFWSCVGRQLTLTEDFILNLSECTSGARSLPEEVQQVSRRNEKTQSQRIERGQYSPMIKLFLSHSSQDRKLAEALVELVTGTIKITDEAIRCTSVPGFKLSTGDHTSSKLKEELKGASVVVGLLTQQSLTSSYVLFELGAAWGADTRIKPLLGPDVDYPDLQGPLKENNVAKVSDRNAMVQLIHELADILGVETKSGMRIDRRVTSFLEEVSSLPKA